MPSSLASVHGVLAALVMTAGFCSGAVELEWAAHPGYRTARLTVSGRSTAGFADLPAATCGILFTNRLDEERSLTNQIYLNGSGVAAGDVNGDGLCDLYFCGLDSPNALYRNLGQWRFFDATREAGVACADQASTGAVLADIDGDGDLDLLVNGIARGTRLFVNDGQGHFHEATDEGGLRSSSGATSMTLADADGDGLLDLYVVNYRSDTMRDMPDIRFRMGITNGISQLLTVNGRPADSPDLVGRFTFDQASGVMENGEADGYYRNRGAGRFERVGWETGDFRDENGLRVATPYDWGLSAMFYDLNADGAPDLYVCNDFQSPDRIWLNDGHGHFQAAADRAARHTSLFSMGIDCADFDRDGHVDFFVADMLSREHARRQVQVMDAMAFSQIRNSMTHRPQAPRNMLFHNRGDGTFAEMAQFSGVDASDWSWCPVFLDVDLDGFEDLLVTTGHWRDAQHADVAREIEETRQRQRLPAREQLRLRRQFPRLDTPNFAFRNRGDWTFEEMGKDWGFASRRISQGIALADLDNDGDLDAVINCLNDSPLICRNDTSAPRVAVRLRGQPPNTRGIGARVTVRAAGLPPQSQQMICGGRYLSSDEAQRTFATGRATGGIEIDVAWRDGRRSVISNAAPNQVFEVEEAIASPKAPFSPPASARGSAFFSDASHRLGHEHADEAFDDFARQPLLPHSLSRWGPGLAWFDFNGDGWEDLLVGTGRGGRLGVFRNDHQGGFVRQRARFLEVVAETDDAAVLGWRGGGTNLSLLFGSAAAADQGAHPPWVRELSLATGEFLEMRQSGHANAGPLALADVDRDGDLDLFVGGRLEPGRYPKSTASALYSNEKGLWILNAAAGEALAEAGLVSGAVFTDLDGDGWPDLVLARDWGSLGVWRNDRGRLRPWVPGIVWAQKTMASPGLARLDQLTGWWNSIAAGDLDNDGRIDLVAGNWGRNTARNRYLERPVRLYFGDPDGSGRTAQFEAHYDSDLGRYVPARDVSALGVAFPILRQRFPSFTSFSTVDADAVIASGLPPMQVVEAATMDSVVLLNRGDTLEVRPLPSEVQMSPVFGVAVGDLDGDGNEDVVLSQNFFGVPPGESRHDAGCGLWLRGDGRGNLVPVPASESGVRIEGEGRGLALADFDHDGRLDIVAGQHRGATKLFRNVEGRPGRRLRLQGPAGNPDAIGARIREIRGDLPAGPAREVRAGGGYWSQDSPTLVVGRFPGVDGIEVRWPDGTTQRAKPPAEGGEWTCRHPGVSNPP